MSEEIVLFSSRSHKKCREQRTPPHRTGWPIKKKLLIEIEQTVPFYLYHDCKLIILTYFVILFLMMIKKLLSLLLLELLEYLL